MGPLIAPLCSLAFAASLGEVSALEGITAPSQVVANNPFQVTFDDGNGDSYRVYLAAQLANTGGPACYLSNQTSISSPLSLTIPSGVGPSADYYSIGLLDLTTSDAVAYSNNFSLTGATAQYSEYEDALGGAAFWNADDLPCGSYACARQCAQDSYPADLTEVDAYNTMKQCILHCDGVTIAPSQTAPPLASDAQVTSGGPEEALVTLGPNTIMTALLTTATTGGSTIEEAIIGSMTLTHGGAAATISSKVVSLASSGIKVGSTTTVAFTSVAASSHAPTATSKHHSGDAGKNHAIGAMAAGLAGLVAFF